MWPGRSEHFLRACESGCSDAEVDEPNRAFFVDDHVARRDVAMNDARLAVRVVESATDFDPDVRSLFGR